MVSAHHGVTALLEQAAHAAAEGSVESEPLRIRHRTLLRQLDLESELLDRYLLDLTALLGHVRARGRLLDGELDYILSYGERMSVRVTAAALNRRGLAATPVDAFDLGLLTESCHGGARPLAGIQETVRKALAEIEGIAVVTGFLARDEHGNLTTLGKNGSDLTASLLAEALGARELLYWKRVGGIMTADPAAVPTARVIEELSYSLAAEYAFHGAEVLHPQALEPARRAHLEVRIADVEHPERQGTRIVRGAGQECARRPVGIASRSGLALLELPLGTREQRARELATIFGQLAAHGLEAGLLRAAGERAQIVVVENAGLESLLETLGEEVLCKRLASVLALVGPQVGEQHALGVSARELLIQAGVAVEAAFIGCRAHSQAFLVPNADLRRGLGVLHAAFLE